MLKKVCRKQGMIFISTPFPFVDVTRKNSLEGHHQPAEYTLCAPVFWRCHSPAFKAGGCAFFERCTGGSGCRINRPLRKSPTSSFQAATETAVVLSRMKPSARTVPPSNLPFSGVIRAYLELVSQLTVNLDRPRAYGLARTSNRCNDTNRCWIGGCAVDSEPHRKRKGPIDFRAFYNADIKGKLVARSFTKRLHG
jgi:hypothetical protein